MIWRSYWKERYSLNVSSGFHRGLLMELKKFQFQLSSFFIENCLTFSFHCIMPFFILLSSTFHLCCWTQAVFSARVLKQGRTVNTLMSCVFGYPVPPDCPNLDFFINKKMPKYLGKLTWFFPKEFPEKIVLLRFWMNSSLQQPPQLWGKCKQLKAGVS